MANFPTVNSPGDTFHSGSNLYSWTGTAWKIVAGDRPDYGVVTFEPQDLDTSGIVSLFHFDDVFADASSGGFSSVDGSTSPQYSTTSKWGSHSFDATNTSNRAQFLPPSLTGDFTIECWVRLNNVNANAYHNPIISGPIAGTSNWQYPGFQLMWEGTGQGWMYTYKSLAFHQYNGTNHQSTVTPYSIVGSDIDGSGNPGLEAGVWSHIAVVRQITGSTCTISLYINGIRHKEDTGKEIRDMTFTTHSGTGNHWIVGRMTNNLYPLYYWGTSTSGGQIDEVVVYDEAKYTGSSYTIPVGPASPVTSPPAIAGKSQIYAKDVVIAPSSSGAELLLHFDGNLNDTSGNNHTVGSNGTIAYSSSGAGGLGASGYGQGLDFDNSSTCLTVSDMDIGTSNFTVEFWWKWPGGTNYNTFLVTNPSSGQTGAFAINHATPWGHAIWVNQYNGSITDSTYLYTGFSGITGNWYHWAIVRNQTQMRLYIGEAGDTNGNYKTAATATPYYVGGIGADWKLGQSSGNYILSGSFADFRVTKDELYTGTGTYPLPTAPFPDGNPGSNTTELYMMDGSGTETKLT